MREKLNENSCRNRGFILDGYPRTFIDAQKVFLVRKKKFIKDDDGNLIPDPEQEEEPDSENEEPPAAGEEKKEKSYEDYEPDSTIIPSCFI